MKQAIFDLMDFFKKRGLAWTSFDALYEQSLHFEEVYEKIVEQLLERATSTEVVYAVPGHPSVAEKTVKLLRERCPDHLATNKIDAKIKALRCDQAYRCRHQNQADRKGPYAPFEKIDVGVITNEFEQFHGNILKSSIQWGACA
jgi:hypothetical protein